MVKMIFELLSVAMLLEVALGKPDPDPGVLYAAAPEGRGQFYDKDRGVYNYGYNTGDGIAKVEVKHADGSITGSYRYYDPYGRQILRSYIADKNGFRVLGNDLPVAVDMPAIGNLQAQTLTAAVEGTSNSRNINTFSSNRADIIYTDPCSRGPCSSTIRRRCSSSGSRCSTSAASRSCCNSTNRSCCGSTSRSCCSSTNRSCCSSTNRSCCSSTNRSCCSSTSRSCCSSTDRSCCSSTSRSCCSSTDRSCCSSTSRSCCSSTDRSCCSSTSRSCCSSTDRSCCSSTDRSCCSSTSRSCCSSADRSCCSSSSASTDFFNRQRDAIRQQDALIRRQEEHLSQLRRQRQNIFQSGSDLKFKGYPTSPSAQTNYFYAKENINYDFPAGFAYNALRPILLPSRRPQGGESNKRDFVIGHAK